MKNKTTPVWAAVAPDFKILSLLVDKDENFYTPDGCRFGLRVTAYKKQGFGDQKVVHYKKTISKSE